jgi:hypothetical protein
MAAKLRKLSTIRPSTNRPANWQQARTNVPATVAAKPKEKITLRQGARVVMKNWTELRQGRTRRLSPDGNGHRQCERGDHKADTNPSSIYVRPLGKHEKMDEDPQAHREPHGNPD